MISQAIHIIGTISIFCSILSIILSLYSIYEDKIIKINKEETKKILKMSAIVWIFALVSTLVLFGLVYIK